MKSRELLDLVIVLIAAIAFSIFSISINLLNRVFSFFDAYTSLPIAEFLINVVFISLAGLLWVTYRRWREAARKKAELENIVRSISPDVLMVVDPDRNIIMCNASVKRMFGYEVDEVINQKTDILYFDRRPDSRQRRPIFQMLERHGFHIGLARGKKKNGEIMPLEIITGNLSGCRGAVLLLRDITERKQAEETLRRERDNLISILDAMKDGVYIVNQRYDIEYVNPPLNTEFGSFRGKKCYEYFYDRKEVCPWCKDKEVFAGKTVRWEWYSPENKKTYEIIDTPVKNPDGSVSKLQIFHDITEHKQKEKALNELQEKYRHLYERMKEMVETDFLTGLFKHNRINELLEQEIERAKRGSYDFSILMLDVEDLKPISDTYGHVVRERLLQDVASILRSTCRSIDLIGHYAEDEFIVILPYTDEENVKIMSQRIFEQAKQRKFKIDERIGTSIHLNIGMATYPDDSVILSELVALADKRMRESKRSRTSIVSTGSS